MVETSGGTALRGGEHEPLRIPFLLSLMTSFLAFTSSVLAVPTPSSELVEVHFEYLNANQASPIPVTFGHVFAPGDVPMGMTLAAHLPGGGHAPLQVDTKATHADGSLRHAVLTTRLDPLTGDGFDKLILSTTYPGIDRDPITIDALLATDFETVVNLTIADVPYRVSARELLIADATQTWLTGELVTEWMVSSPMIDPVGHPHPHLAARFNIRVYGEGPEIERVRVDVVIENTWSFVPHPQNYTYDAQILIGGNEAFRRMNLEHYSHARWRQVLWWGQEPQVHVIHDTGYLIETKAVPNYDQRIVIAESALASMEEEWISEDRGPMTIGFAEQYMPATGGRRDIGPMPRWSARYLLSMDRRAKTVSLGTATLAGTWNIHYRDQLTGLPVSLDDYPTMSLLSNNNPDQFPDCSDCSTPNIYDSAHQPALAYLPYLVTGDHYYLEELQFWANLNMIESNPGYRGGELGLLQWGQVRGQAWSLRTLGQAAYITPDDHPMKAYFEDRVGYNLDWYAQAYLQNQSTNELGFIENGYAYTYSDGQGIATWQDDYFTWATGYLAELGFEDAQPIVSWKGMFPTGRMTDPGYCWIMGSPYFVRVRGSSSDPVYPDFGMVYRASFPSLIELVCASEAMADLLGLQIGEMSGYSRSPQGYPSYMQPALAMAVQNCVPNAVQAWDIFMDRSVKPDYGLLGPEFAIVPRFNQADLDQDGQVDFFDASYFIDNRIDFNRDGTFNFFDISAFLNAFAQRCT